MTTEEAIQHASYFVEELRALHARSRISGNGHSASGLKAQVVDFLRIAAGPKSAFTQQAQSVEGVVHYQATQLAAIVQGFMGSLKRGLGGAVSPERKAQLDTVSDLLEQAQQLLDDKAVHPAAPAVLIGATLEEFLRGWIEANDLSLGNRKPGLNNYALVLLEAEMISKQDMKDIQSWGGLRNHAAHGEWSEVDNRQRIFLMLEGINLFLRKHGASGTNDAV